MIIENAECYLLELPLNFGFKHSLKTRTSTKNVIVKLESEGKVGFGESIPRDYVTNETPENTFVLTKEYLKTIIGQKFHCLDDIQIFTTQDIDDKFPSVQCAIELALMDLFGKIQGIPLTRLFYRGVRELKIPYSAVIPDVSGDKLKMFLQIAKELELKNIKLKIGKHINTKVIEEIYNLLGYDINLRVDANGSWSLLDAKNNLPILRHYHVRALEQPFPKDVIHDASSFNFMNNSDIQIIADESLCSVNDAIKLAERGTCDIFNIRVSKCGGITNSLDIMDIADEHGIQYQIGCHVGETGILSAAGRYLAEWYDPIYLEGSFGKWILREDIIKEDIRFYAQGKAPFLEGPGLGVTVDEEKIAKYKIREV